MENNTNPHFNSFEQGNGQATMNKPINPKMDYSLIQQVNDLAGPESTHSGKTTVASEDKKQIGMFTVMPANEWIEQAKNRPIPKMLFSEFWFEGELCILFADTNLGKSILAVQIADSISRGENVKGFQLEARKQPVLFLDFELSDKQLENRYSIDYEQHYSWDANFIRIEINPDADFPAGQSFEDYLNESLELAIKNTGAKVIVIDNITYLRNDNEKAKDALPLMKHLMALKRKYGLSILVLAHTPKRDSSKPLNQNDLQGSKMLINFCDSAFAIGASSQDGQLRYLKQVKQRNTEQIFDSDNVCICQINKPFNFLQFELLSFGTELEHLKQRTNEEKEGTAQKVMELNRQGKSLRQIGTELGISHMRASRILGKKDD